MCGPCNAGLAKRFEEPAKPLVRALFASEGNISFNMSEATIVGLWFVKTWVLLTHPACRHSEPALGPEPWSVVPDDLYSWMVTGQTPPAALSVWLTKEDRRLEVLEIRHLPLPTVVADGRETQFQALRFGLRSLQVSLVYHPGWEIEHPLEAERRAIRLWPRATGATADFTAMPAVAPRDTCWLKGPLLHFRDGVFGNAELPPLSADFDSQALPLGSVQLVAW
jgi:hypothetical protein